MIEHEGVIYNSIEVVKAETVINIVDIEELISKFENSKCVQNSHLIAEKINIKCVEGFVYCMVANGDRIDDKIIRHCWNKVDDNYFDITKDFIWDETDIPKKFIYFPIAEYESNEYDFSQEKLFLSNAVEIAAAIDKELQESLKSENDISKEE